jgi:hypothetical protein
VVPLTPLISDESFLVSHYRSSWLGLSTHCINIREWDDENENVQLTVDKINSPSFYVPQTYEPDRNGFSVCFALITISDSGRPQLDADNNEHTLSVQEMLKSNYAS